MKFQFIVMLLAILGTGVGCTTQPKVGPNGERIEVRRFCGIPYYETTKTSSPSSK
ncbi:MAG: hypothetical protein ACRC37_01600 [Lentisphaeria bacterium]